MTPLRTVPPYVLLLLALALLGAASQGVLRRHAGALDDKARLLSEVAVLRAEAAEVQGPLAVGRWARERGMVPAPEVTAVRHVAPSPAPSLAVAATGTEVRTVWR